MRRFELSDEQRVRVEGLLPGAKGDPGLTAESSNPATQREAFACGWRARRHLAVSDCRESPRMLQDSQ